MATATHKFCPSMVNAFGSPLIFWDWVDQMATPLTSIMVVRVAMKAGMRQIVTAAPLMAPSVAPTSSIAITPSGTASALPASKPSSALMIFVPTTLARAIMEVTERSMPPMMRATVIPTETTRMGSA